MDKIMVTKSSMPEYEEFIQAIKPLWTTHWLTNMGEFHQKLENELLGFLKISNISLFTNGHLALELAIQALKLKGEVITTPFTFASTTHAIVRNGLTPVFCDIDPVTFTIDVTKIENLITDKTCAIIPVHVYGNVCDVEAIDRIAKKYNLKVIYDSAHAFGVEYKGRGIGTYGDASMFSFHATKVFNTIEGGAICYTDSEFGTRLYQLKNFGIKNEEIVDAVGSNAKMNEFQAVMGLCNLKKLECEIEKRKRVTEKYLEELSLVDGLTLPIKQANVKKNYAYFPVLFDEKEYGFSRDQLYDKLRENNIFARKYFYPLTNTFDCYKEMFDTLATPVAMDVSKRVLTLPLYSDLELENVERVCNIIRIR